VRKDSEEGELSGTLRVSMPAGIGDSLLIPVLAAFLHKHPRIHLDALATDKAVELREAGVDLALRFGWSLSGDFVARKLATFDEVLVASPGYLQARGMPAALQDLARHGWIGATVFCGTRQNIQCRDAGGRIAHVAVECRLRTSDATSQKARALQGLGICRLPRFFVSEISAEGGLWLSLQAGLSRPARSAAYSLASTSFRINSFCCSRACLKGYRGPKGAYMTMCMGTRRTTVTPVTPKP
jgi:DNA-binding transcriptional LysR family regulator